MTSGAIRNIGNVNQFEFDDAGKLLAYTVDATDRLGNGVYLFEPATGVTRALNTAQADYDQLTWTSDGTGLAVLRGDKVRGMKQKANALLGWTGVTTAGGKPFTYDPAADAGFPKGMVLSEFTAPRWSRDGSRLFVGIKEQRRRSLRPIRTRPTSTSGITKIRRPNWCRLSSCSSFAAPPTPR